MPFHTKTKKSLTLESSEDVFFIPDLCNVHSVLFLLILTQLLSIVLCLAITNDRLISWESLGYLSLFCHTIALSFAATMCLSRPYLRNRNILFISFYFLFTNFVITLFFSWFSNTALTPFFLNSTELFTTKACIISLMIACILLRYFYLQAQWREQKQSELKARIQALQARIRPHFLFNSMNSIASLISINPQQAEDAILDLCSLFRATLNNQQALIPIDEEIELCKRYLNIEALRLGKRLQLDWKIAQLNKSIEIPPLTLQPLFENAIYHGIQPRKEGGKITLVTEEKNNMLSIMISNPFSDTKSSHEGNHIALDNIRSRIQAIFGEKSILKTSMYNDIFTVTLRIPIQGKGAKKIVSKSISVFIVDDEELARERLKRLIDSLDGYETVGEAENGDQALKDIPQCTPDIILLDIRMPGTDGLSVAQSLSQTSQPPAIIFCTAYDDYAISAFKYNAIGYLLKPVRKEELINALNNSQKFNQLQIKKVEEHISTSSKSETKNFVANTWQGQEIIPFNSIYFFKSDQKYLTVVHQNGESLSDQTLKDLEKNHPDLLIRVHRNTLINKAFISGLIKDQDGHYHVKIKNTDHLINVSRRHSADVKAYLSDM